MSQHGLYPALVTDIVDPDRLGRVQVELPGLGAAGRDLRLWATLLTPYADDDQGFVALPAVGTQVVVAFETGSLHRAYVVGSCWNGKQAMPVTPTRTNDKRVLRSRSGAVVEFDDTAGAAAVTVRSGAGHTVRLDDGGSSIHITHAGGCDITLDPAGKVVISGNSGIELHAPQVTVDAGSSTFTGTISCLSITTSAGVVSPLYSPGAGNVW